MYIILYTLYICFTYLTNAAQGQVSPSWLRDCHYSYWRRKVIVRLWCELRSQRMWGNNCLPFPWIPKRVGTLGLTFDLQLLKLPASAFDVLLPLHPKPLWSPVCHIIYIVHLFHMSHQCGARTSVSQLPEKLWTHFHFSFWRRKVIAFCFWELR